LSATDLQKLMYKDQYLSHQKSTHVLIKNWEKSLSLLASALAGNLFFEKEIKEVSRFSLNQEVGNQQIVELKNVLDFCNLEELNVKCSGYFNLIVDCGGPYFYSEPLR